MFYPHAGKSIVSLSNFRTRNKRHQCSADANRSFVYFVLRFPLLHDFQTVPPDMAKQEQHPHACGFCFDQRCTKLRLRANIRSHLGDTFHLDHE